MRTADSRTGRERRITKGQEMRKTRNRFKGRKAGNGRIGKGKGK